MKSTLLACTLLAAATSAAPLAAQNNSVGCANGNCAIDNSGGGNCANGNCATGNCAGGNCASGNCASGHCGHKHCNHVPKCGNRSAQYRAAQSPWHGGYYYTQWGAPVALVVPPTAEYQTNYSWGVPASRVERIDHQFQRPFPGYGYGGGYGFLPTPMYPSDTTQFGVYYVRGPW